ncbi:hypothetical protein CEUSTIGMA_g9867.t1 [Chlamydomonas eustigma]|uniref:Uncharacterized protein n=1 Tax=Chlamydomonas eustigma TaxID=1157962 RepID=A0A250XHP2_9CHLO|nr:hypothetical protein CEUSTIGMA_g9867.t1 [Chlamydomonas eustigma]|eukprot:GAX82439.1 hypothetical protein CEUSTIGMA_g9867.t1 [Chlamydomonas eustigma]
MAYNLYHVQMSNAWAQRCEKEMAQAERFWTAHASKNAETLQASALHKAPSVAPTGSVAGTNQTSRTTYLKERLDKLDQELQSERNLRKKVEEELAMLKATQH